MNGLSEFAVEDAALGWIESLGWRIAHGPDLSACDAQAGIALNAPGPERMNYREVVLVRRLAAQAFSGELRVQGVKKMAEAIA